MQQKAEKASRRIGNTTIPGKPRPCPNPQKNPVQPSWQLLVVSEDTQKVQNYYVRN